MAAQPRLILGHEFGKALMDAGVIPAEPGMPARIVIDVDPAEPLRVYVEYFGDERWLDVAVHACGVEIITRPRET